MRTAATLLGLAATVSLAPATLPAQAAPLSQPAPAKVMPANTVTDCLGSGKVWLVVQDSKGQLMHNQCVAKGATGESLLKEAGVKLTYDSKTKMICAMDSEPASCPTTFDGNYWQYYTATKGGKWTYATKGASQSVPKAGTLEGWCYGSKCTPTMPSLTADVAETTGSASATPSAAASTAPATDQKKSSHTGAWVAGLVVLVLAAAGAVLARRRRA